MPNAWRSFYSQRTYRNEPHRYCRWHNPDWDLVHNPKYAGPFWPYLKGKDIHICPGFPRIARMFGTRHPEHVEGVPVVPNYNYSMNSYLSEKKITSMKSHAEIFFFGEENLWITSPYNSYAFNDTACCVYEQWDSFGTFHLARQSDMEDGVVNAVFLDGQVKTVNRIDSWRYCAPDPKGTWEFNAPDTTGATVGAPLEIVGFAQVVPGVNAQDNAISIGEGSYYICSHGIAPNGGGAKVNEWTLLIDFSYPLSSLSDPPNGYNDLFQIDPTNTDDADWTINSSGAIGIGAVGYSDAFGYTTGPNTWYRMVVVVDNGVRHDLYVDGVEILKGNQQGIDGRFSLADELLLFAAGNSQDGDDARIFVSTVAIWDVPLSANEILTLGGAGESVFKENLAPIVDAGVDRTVELDETSTAVVNLEGIVTDDDEALTISWDVISGPDDAVIEPADSSTATATVTTPGQYVFELSANDGLYTVTDEVLINTWVHDYN
ncbi:MAG: PKD domain-containing protein, partial [Planctomycetota bacterium]